MNRASVVSGVGWQQTVTTVALVAVVLVGGCSGSPDATVTGTPDTDRAATTDNNPDGATASTESPDAGEQATATATTQPPVRTDGGENQTPETTAAKPAPSALDSRLYALTTADDPASYAETHGIEYRDGSVTVVVELEPGAALPREFDLTVTATADDRVQASVPVGQLIALAEHENTTVVRTPDAANSAGAANTSSETHP